jgi:hypothetical protein
MMLALRPAAPTKKLFSTKAMSLTLTSPITMKIAVTYQPPKMSPKNTPFPLEVKCPPMLPLAAPRKNRKRIKTIKMAADAKMEERKENSKTTTKKINQPAKLMPTKAATAEVASIINHKLPTPSITPGKLKPSWWDMTFPRKPLKMLNSHTTKTPTKRSATKETPTITKTSTKQKVKKQTPTKFK